MGYNQELHNQWTTADEQRYIDDLVSREFWRKCAYTPRHQPAELIMIYIGNAQRRIKHKTFGAIDGEAVILYAKSKLKSILKKKA